MAAERRVKVVAAANAITMAKVAKAQVRTALAVEAAPRMVRMAFAQSMAAARMRAVAVKDASNGTDALAAAQSGQAGGGRRVVGVGASVAASTGALRMGKGGVDGGAAGARPE